MNISKEGHFQYIKNNYLFVVDWANNRVPNFDSFKNLFSDAKNLNIYYDSKEDVFTFNRVNNITPDVIEYNLIVKNFVEYTNGYLSEVRSDYYNGDYTYATIEINNKIELPDIKLSEYDEVEPNMIDVEFVSFYHSI